MPVKTAMSDIANHVKKIIDDLNNVEIENMLDRIHRAKRIFLMGTGRSGMAAKAFAMRLAQMGLNAYVVGETVTPAITKNDLFIAISGSGETDSVVNAAKIVKKIGAKVLVVTSYPESTLGRLADNIVKVRGRTKIDIERDHLKSQLEGKHMSLTPLGTLFEDTVMIFLDGITAGLMYKLGKDEIYMKNRHATLE